MGYIEDIFFSWDHVEDKLKTFVVGLNKTRSYKN